MPRWKLGLPIAVLLASACSSGSKASAVVDAGETDDGAPQVIVGHGILGVQVWESSGVARYRMGAWFRNGPPPTQSFPAWCTVQTVGACSFQKCIPPVVDAGAPTDAAVGAESENDAGSIPYDPPADGGDVTLSGLLGPNPDSGVQGNDITLNKGNGFGDDGYRVLWNGGEKLHVSTTGGADAPPIALDVIAPTRVEITSPILADGLVVDRSVPLALAWTPSSAGELTVSISSPNPSVFENLSCSMPASAGTGTIPAAALALLTPGAESYLEFSHANTATIVKTGWKFTVALTTDLRGKTLARLNVK